MANYLMQQLDRHLMKLFVPTEEELTHYQPDESPNSVYFGIGMAYVFLYFIVIPVLLVLIIQYALGASDDFTLVMTQVLTGVIYMLLVVVTTPWKKWFPSWKYLRFDWKKIVAYWVLIYSTNIILASIYLSLGIDGMGGNQEAIDDMVMMYPVLMGIAVVILAPLVEEVMFRFFIFGFLKRYNIWLAFAVSSFAFGLVHVIQDLANSWMFIFIYFSMGWLLALSYHHHKRLLIPILVHALNNLVGYVIMLLMMLFDSLGA